MQSALSARSSGQAMLPSASTAPLPFNLLLHEPMIYRAHEVKHICLCLLKRDINDAGHGISAGFRRMPLFWSARRRRAKPPGTALLCILYGTARPGTNGRGQCGDRVCKDSNISWVDITKK